MLNDVWDRVFGLWAQGESFNQIAELLGLAPVETGPSLRAKIKADGALIARMRPYNLLRAHMLTEQAVEWGFEAASRGDAKGLKLGIVTAMKAAALALPEFYGAKKKVGLKGKGGGKTLPKAGIALTPTEAYERVTTSCALPLTHDVVLQTSRTSRMHL